MRVVLIHWTSLRRGDLFAPRAGEAARVAGVMLNGVIWDVEGSDWIASHPKGLVALLLPDTSLARDVEALKRYTEQCRKFVVEDRT